MNILETERLILSEFTFDDAAFILELLNTPAWLQFIGDRNVKTTDDAKNYLTNGPLKSYQKFGFGLYRVSLKNENIPVGMCGLLKRDTLEHPDIGFAFLPEHEKKGYAFEAAFATLVYAKTNLKLERIVAITTAENQNSIALLKKLKMTFEKTIKFPAEEEELMLFANDSESKS